MLIEFSVKNFRSIKEEQTFSMLASSEKGLEKNRIQLEKYKSMKVLNSAILMGANGSGKSNLLRAITALMGLISSSDQNGPNKKISQYSPFKLNSSHLKEPTEFELEFCDTEGVRYLYTVAFDSDKIIKESLKYYPRVKEIKVFERIYGRDIEFGRFSGSKKKIESLLLPNQLFLTKAAKSQNKFLEKVFLLITQMFNVIGTGIDFGHAKINTIQFIRQSEKNKSLVHSIMRAADLGISDLKVKKESPHELFLRVLNGIEMLPEKVKEQAIEDATYQPLFLHETQSGQQVEFQLSDESYGTAKLFELSSNIVTALENGSSLIIDEINNGLHPVLGLFILELFQDPEINTKRAQIIFTTHEASFLSEDLFRKDQVWFAEKNQFGESEIYSLSEFSDSPKLADKKKSLQQWYLSGRFGAIPVIRDLLMRDKRNG